MSWVDKDDWPSGNPRFTDRDVANRLANRDRYAAPAGLPKPRIVAVVSGIGFASRN
jgi:hypothetical protein